MDLKLMTYSHSNQSQFVNSIGKKIFSILSEDIGHIWNVFIGSSLTKNSSLFGPLLLQSLNHTQNIKQDCHQYIRMIWNVNLYSLLSQNASSVNEIRHLAKSVITPIGFAKWMLHHFPEFKIKNVSDKEAQAALFDYDPHSEIFHQIHKKIISDDLNKYSNLNKSYSYEAISNNETDKVQKSVISNLELPNLTTEIELVEEDFKDLQESLNLNEDEMSSYSLLKNQPESKVSQGQSGAQNLSADVDSIDCNNNSNNQETQDFDLETEAEEIPNKEDCVLSESVFEKQIEHNDPNDKEEEKENERTASSNLQTYQDVVDEFEKEKTLKGIPIVECEDIRHLFPTPPTGNFLGDRLFDEEIKATKRVGRRRRRY